MHLFYRQARSCERKPIVEKWPELRGESVRMSLYTCSHTAGKPLTVGDRISIHNSLTRTRLSIYSRRPPPPSSGTSWALTRGQVLQNKYGWCDTIGEAHDRTWVQVWLCQWFVCVCGGGGRTCHWGRRRSRDLSESHERCRYHTSKQTQATSSCGRVFVNMCKLPGCQDMVMITQCCHPLVTEEHYVWAWARGTQHLICSWVNVMTTLDVTPLT